MRSASIADDCGVSYHNIDIEKEPQICADTRRLSGEFLETSISTTSSTCEATVST